MRNAALIIGGLALVAVIIAIIIFATAPKPTLPVDNSTPSPGGNNSGTGGSNSGGTGGGSSNTSNTADIIDGMKKADIQALAASFRDEFSRETTTMRCGIITSVNQLSSSQLSYFNTVYKQSYNTTPNAQMDAASVWCWYSNADDAPLYEKLKGLNSQANTINVGEMVNGMYKTAIAEIADKFYTKFSSWGGYRCDVINEANALLPGQLDYFKTYHYAKYAKTAKEMMDAATGWCPGNNTTAYNLYARL